MTIIGIVFILLSIIAKAQPNWNYTITSNSHTVSIENVTINGSQIPFGDYIGAFYSDNGNLVCGGYLYWLGGPGAFMVYGDDPLTPQKDGFLENEPFFWRTYRQVNEDVVTMTPSISIGLNNFENNGISILSNLEGVSLVPPFQYFPTVYNESCFGGCNGSIYLYVVGGQPPFTYAWSNGSYTNNPANLCAGTYTVTITNYTGVKDSTEIAITSPSEITVTETISNYNGFEISLTGMADGSILLAPSGGVPPYSYYWSNYATSNPNQGLSAGVYSVTIYDSIGCAAFRTYQLQEPELQLIPLNTSWNLFSTFLNPIIPNIANALLPIHSSVIIVKNGDGLIYWPEWGINLIGNLELGYGYQINLNNADTLEIYGQFLNPDSISIPLNQNWNIIGNVHKNDNEISFLLSGILPNLILLKNELGQAYWPQYNINLIGDIKAGEGYHIKMAQADTLDFPREPAIGDPYRGGIVFYILQPGDPGFKKGEVHGLIAAPTDQSTSAILGCQEGVISGTWTTIGCGAQNTTAIVNACSSSLTAAKICSDLVLGGYNDWYLPSLDEIVKLYLNQTAVGGFSGSAYWSSSIYSGCCGWYINFLYGNTNVMNHYFYYLHVRAIRSF